MNTAPTAPRGLRKIGRLIHDTRKEKLSSAATWWLYLLACKDGRTYAGIALDVETRFQAHADGKAAKFTRANPPRSILGAQEFATRSEAQRAEYALKQLTRLDKLAWARTHRYASPSKQEVLRALESAVSART